MATRKTTAEKLEEVQKKKKEIEAKEKKYMKKLKAEQRKKDTHIKCILGGTVLKVLKDCLSNYEFQEEADEIAIEQLLRGFEAETKGILEEAIEFYRKGKAEQTALVNNTEETDFLEEDNEVEDFF